MSIRPHTFFYYLLYLMALLIQPVSCQDIFIASGGMANNPIVSGELGGMQAGLPGAFFGFVVEKAAAEAASADVTFQFQGTRAWFSLTDLFRTTEQEQNLMKGILQLEVDTQSQTLTGSVITPEPSATMPGVIIYPSMPVPEYSPATSDISLVNQAPILSRINGAILNLIKTVLHSGEWTDTAEVQCRTRYTASNTPISEPTSTPDPAAALKEDERICDVFYNDPFPESFGLYSTDEKNGDLTVEVHNAIGDVLAINPSSTTSSGYQTATLKYQPRQVPETSEQGSSTTEQSESRETSTANQPSSTSTCDPAPAAKKEASNQPLQYKGHRLQAESEYEQDLSNKNCTVCLESFREEKKPLIKLSCGHIYHNECLQAVPNCPECRARIDQSASTIYPSFDSLEVACQLSCLNELCLWCGSFQLLKEDDFCPYPYSYLDNNASGSFFYKRRDFIITWIKEIFERKKFTVHEIKYYEKLKDYGSKIREDSAKEQPCISLVLSHRKFPKPVMLYYSAEDCEKGRKNHVECFQRLILDIRTDLVFTHLQANYAAMWDHSTDMYIWHWELWNNRLLLSVNEQIIPVALDLFWNPDKKDFNFSKLRRAMEEQGLIYADLFKTEPALPIYSPSYSPWSPSHSPWSPGFSPRSPSFSPRSPSYSPGSPPPISPKETFYRPVTYCHPYEGGLIRLERRQSRSRDRSFQTRFCRSSRYAQEAWRESKLATRSRSRSRSREGRTEEQEMSDVLLQGATVTVQQLSQVQPSSFLKGSDFANELLDSDGKDKSPQAYYSEKQPSRVAEPAPPEEGLNLDWLL